MIGDLRITVLAENTVRGAKLLAEHGLAFWIEADGHRILFDTGQGKVLRHNARQLEIPLHAVQTVVISHGHFDHTGGLKELLEAGAEPDLYLHPAALQRKYHREKTPPHRDIGIPHEDEQALRRREALLTLTPAPRELIGGVHVTGEIPRRNRFEDTGGPFYCDPSCTTADPLLDDQALYIDIKMRLLNLTLPLSDKMSMANSVEVRPLFLDHDFVNFTFRIPHHYKIQGLSEKHILL